MSTQEKKISKKIPENAYNPAGSMDLDNCYGQTVSELGLQQSKRDQIIAFYLTILGFVIPNVIDMEVGNTGKGIAFIIMYGVGVIFCHVILRYRIYKEVYWIACRVITQMCNIHEVCRNKEVIYTLFFNSLKKNRDTIVVKNKNKKPSLLKSWKRQLNSAETLLYETLVLFSSFVGLIGSWYFFQISALVATLSFIFIIYMLFKMNYKYAKRLMDLYVCVDTEKQSDLEKTFAKAWMLHCYVDDVISHGKDKDA